MNEEPRILNYRQPLDYRELTRITDLLANRYPFLSVTSLGTSILGKSIPVLILGQGPSHILYIGAHHGMEWLTSVLLLRFVNEFCEFYQAGKTIYRVSLPVFWEHFTLHVIPMLNPDGVDYQINGVSPENPLYSRVLAMNGGSDDFTHWQANARGVDLNHNYDAGFQEYKQLEAEQGIGCGAPTRYSGQEPESEPEVKGLCNYIRFHDHIRLILTLHTQGEEIYYRSGGKTLPGTCAAARKISSLCGYRLSEAEGLASYGGLTDWCIRSCAIPALTLECGKGVNPLPLSGFFPIYARLRETLFVAPGLY